jgi:hypothetical protein
MAEERLDGGNLGGAVRAGDTVRRPAGPWTPAVHALLAHLAAKGFTGAPRPLGFDEQGREVLTFLEGETVGSSKPWPAWTHADDTLDQVARWMRGYHRAVADFVPPPGAVWREGGAWSPGLIIGHNDTAPYVVAAEGFTDFAARPRRLDRFLRAYGWPETTASFLAVVRARVKAHAAGIRSRAAAGDAVFARLLHQGVADDLDQALAELASFWSPGSSPAS